MSPKFKAKRNFTLTNNTPIGKIEKNGFKTAKQLPCINTPQ